MKNELLPGFSSSSVECGVQKSFANSLVKYPSSMLFRHKSHKCNQRKLADTISEIHPIPRSTSQSSAYSELSDVHSEVEQVRLELRKVGKLYNQACEDLVHAQAKVHLLSSDCLEEAQRVNAAIISEEKLRIMAVDEKKRHVEAVKEIEMARNLLSKEINDRQIAEVKGMQESIEKQRIIDALLLGDRRYKRYSRDQIEVATGYFSETKVVGVGSYGKVYKCKIDHTPVAIKVLSSNASDRKDEFLREAVQGVPQIRPGCNPAAWILDVTSSAEEIRLGVDFAEVYRRSELFQQNKRLVDRLCKPDRDSIDLNFPSKYSQSFFGQFITCIWKQNLSYWRNPQFTKSIHRFVHI